MQMLEQKLCLTVLSPPLCLKLGSWGGGGGFSDLCGIALSQGRELRVVMNTNDPDYEHIYSVESYGDTLDELLYFAPTTNQSDGNVFHTVSGAAVH